MLRNIKINDNIELSYIPMNNLKTVTMGVYIHRPLCEEEAAKNAILPYILKQGTANFPTRQILSQRLEEIYGAHLSAGISKRGEDQVISFHTEFIADSFIPNGESLLVEAAQLLCEVIFNPRTEGNKFSEEIFEKEKKNLADRIRAQINDKRAYASDRLCEITCEKTAYAVSSLGSEESVNALDNAELYAYYKKMITSSKINIYLAGEADPEKTASEIRECIAGMEFSAAKIPATEILPARDEIRSVHEKLDVTQGKLAVSFTTGVRPEEEKIWALSVANSVFGGGAHSKLFNNVREKLSLAYYAGSSLHKLKGIILVNAGVEFENFEKAYDEILLQLAELKAGKITEEELVAAKLAIINSLKAYYDDQIYMQSFYLGEKIVGTNYDIEHYISKIESVTMEEVVDAAQSICENSVYYLEGRN